MAYGKKYHTTIWNKGLGQITIDIYKKDYSGAVSPLTIAFEGVRLNVDTVNYFETIMSTSIDIDVTNDKTDFYELDPLFSTSDLEHYIVMFTPTLVLFRGFIPCEVTEQSWLKNGTITISATCNLNRLNEYIPTLFEVKNIYNLMEIIQHCLSFTHLEVSSAELPIYVNCSLREIAEIPGTNTCFDHAWVDSDIFYEDSTTIRDCKTVLQYILGAFDCIIYYYNDAWYIERWRDLGGYAEVKSYIKYLGSTVTLVEEDVPLSLYPQVGKGLDMFCIEQSQRISYSPGLKSIEVTLNETSRLNLVGYYYDDIQLNQPITGIEAVNPSFGYWESIDESDIIVSNGSYLDKMTNWVSVKNDWTDPEYNWGAYIWIYTGSSNLSEKLRRSATGVYAKFKIKMNEQDSTNPTDDVTTNINIAFSLKFSDDFITQKAPHVRAYPSLYKFWVRFFLKFDDNGTTKWVKFNGTTNQYEMVTMADMTSIGYDMPIIQESFLYENLTNKTQFYHEFSTSIALGNAVHEVVGDTPEFVLGIMQIGITNKQQSWEDGLPNYVLKESIYGDIYITSNTEVDDNVIMGTIADNFVTVEKDDMFLFDSNNYSISNGLYRNTDREHTLMWRDNFSIEMPLSKYFIQDRFQIYNIVRRHLISDMMAYMFIKPFEMVDGNLLNKVFCVNGYKYIVDSDRYESIQLSEYVNDDDVS